MDNFERWQDSGRLMTRKDFLSRFPTIKLLGACDDVMLYDGGHYIQGLFDGSWYECNTNRSKKLDEVEMNIFLEKVSKKID
jgi:hypothetical protein